MSTKPTVVVTLPYDEDVLRKHLARRAKIIEVRTRRELEQQIAFADGLVTLLTYRVDEKLLKKAPRLRAVGNMAVGVNNIDLAALARRKIRLANTPKVLDRATAECALALLLAAARRVPEGERMCRANAFKGWAPDLLLGLELHGRHAVVVGPGRIGGQTAKLFRAIGLKVSTIGSGASSKEIRKKLSRAQVVSLHVPLTQETHHWLDKTKLALLPHDAIVINTSRGPVVDERALIAALRHHKIFAAGLDVYEHEPNIPPALRKLPNVVLLPHLGSATRETRGAMATLAVTGCLGLLDGKRIPNEVKISSR